MSGFAGFDASSYPGDAVMAWLLANTNLVWCGYYLAPAPSHGDTSWMGKRAALAAAGWGFAPTYLGQQVIRPGSLDPSAANGALDGAQAVSLMQSEGFAPGACVYLDIENGPPLTQLQQDYTSAWCNTVANGGFTPGVYCSHLLAATVQNLCPAARIWAFKVPTNAPHAVTAPFPTPDPSGCGYAAAQAWQLDQNGTFTLPPGVHPPLGMDTSSALTADPSA